MDYGDPVVMGSNTQPADELSPFDWKNEWSNFKKQNNVSQTYSTPVEKSTPVEESTPPQNNKSTANWWSKLKSFLS